KVAAAVTPGARSTPASGEVARRRRTHCTVDPSLTARSVAGYRHCAASPHPRPLARSRIELPQVIEEAVIVLGIIPLAAEEPETAVCASPTPRLVPGSWNISGR